MLDKLLLSITMIKSEFKYLLTTRGIVFYGAIYFAGNVLAKTIGEELRSNKNSVYTSN